MIAKKLKDGKWGKQGIDKGCSLCCWLEAVITFEALWGFSLEPRQQFVWSSRYNQINDVKCKHFILWSGPEPEPDKNVYMNEVYEILRHSWPLQTHIPCKPRPHIKKNPEEIVLPWCLALIVSIFCDSYMWKREKDFGFSLQDMGPWTGDRTEPNKIGEGNKDIFLPFSGFCCLGFCRCHVLRAALLFSPNLR